MSRFEGPQGIVTNGLVLNLDAGDPDSYTRSQPPYVEVLVVAGGGCGGNGNGTGYEAGGGGAGGVIYNSAYQITNAAAITVTIGAGGGSKTGAGNGNNGSNSVFGSLTAIGGGGGSTGGGAGQSGGSGGGGAHPKTQGGAGTAGQGFEGFTPPDFSRGGGGGGAGGPGSFGVGGNGVAYSISGVSTYYGGGGGGTVYSPNNGGLGGGGNGSTSLNSSATATGAANTGGGGGGGYATTDTIASGGAGGSGIVIVRYPGLPAATGGTITYLNGYTIHTFTTSGTFTPYLWNDVSGNGNNGNVNNGTSFIPNINGGTLVFDNTDDYVSVPQSTSVNITTNTITFGGWCYPIVSNKYQHILVKNVNESRQYGMWLSTFGTSQIFRNLNGVISQGNVTISTPWSVNAWNYIMLVYNGSTIKIYLNGAEVFSENASGNIVTTNSNVNIGGEPTQSFFFNGRIAVAQIYNRALSAAEITQNFNAQRARFGI